MERLRQAKQNPYVPPETESEGEEHKSTETREEELHLAQSHHSHLSQLHVDTHTAADSLLPMMEKQSDGDFTSRL